MLSNSWNNILDWFRDRSERSKLVRSFNESARNSFVGGIAPTLLKTKISKGKCIQTPVFKLAEHRVSYPSIHRQATIKRRAYAYWESNP